MKLVIGIVGPPLAGKETAADAFAELLGRDGFSVSRHRFSDVLRETLDLWGMPHGRDNEQRLAQLMARLAEGTLSRAVEHRIANDAADVGILDGVRWFSDEEMIRSFAKRGIKNLLVYVLASPDVRYERLRRRNRAGEASVTRAEFDRQMAAENETYIPEIGGRADIKLMNEYADVQDFRKDAARAYQKTIRPLL